MDGDKLYRINVGHVVIGGGLSLHEQHPAIEATVAGKKIALDGASNVGVEGWHYTRSEALRAAAKEVLKVAGVLASQVERLQKEAAECES